MKVVFYTNCREKPCANAVSHQDYTTKIVFIIAFTSELKCDVVNSSESMNFTNFESLNVERRI